MRCMTTLLSVSTLIIGVIAAPAHTEAASPGTVAPKSAPNPSALIVQIDDDDDDDGRARVKRRAKPLYLGHGVRRYYPRRHVGVHRYYRWTYRSYKPAYRKYIPRRHWRGGDDDD